MKRLSLGLSALVALSTPEISADIIQVIPGPISANDAGEGVEILNSDNDTNDWLTTISAGGTIYLGFDWVIHTNAGETGTGGFFGGLGFYDGGAEKVLIGNSWNSLNFGIAGQATDESSTIPYVIGETVRLIAKMTIVDGPDPDTVELFVGQDTEGVPDAVNTLAIDDVSRVLSRAGNAGGWATITNLTIADDFASANAPAGDLDNDGLPDASFEQLIIDAAAAEDPPRTLTIADIKGPNDDPETSDYDLDGLNDADEFSNNTNPVHFDTDGDGLSDGAEVHPHGSSPLLEDSDGDGLEDGDEVNIHGTSPILSDTDSDGFSDPVEVSSGSDPVDQASTPDILSPPDQLLVGGGGAGRTIIDPDTMLAYLGGPADDTYTGTINYAATIEFIELANGTGAEGFTGLQLYLGDDERMAVGDYWLSTTWSGYLAPDGSGTFPLLNSNNAQVPLELNQPETISIVIDMVAGGNDTVTILFRGKETSFTGPLDFDQLRVRSGNTFHVANFSDIRFTVGLLPEEEKDYEITAINHNPETGETKLTWNSDPDQAYQVSFSSDLIDWSGEVADRVDSTGDSTSLEFNVGTLGIGGAPSRLFFRVTPVD